MSTSTDAILCYGFELEPNGKIILLEDLYSDKRPAYDSLTIQGQIDMRNKCPIEIVLHSSFDHPMHILAVKGTVIEATRGFAERALFKHPNIKQVKDAKAWCREFGFEWLTPEWFICSFYG